VHLCVAPTKFDPRSLFTDRFHGQRQCGLEVLLYERLWDETVELFRDLVKESGREVLLSQNLVRSRPESMDLWSSETNLERCMGGWKVGESRSEPP
jgi:hypothetical protein